MQFGLLLGAALVLFGAPASAPGGVDELDVPFVAQTPLLCGGAAAAMVERYWGARGRDAEDYLPLVEPTEGGIRASDLMSELRDNGYVVHRTTSSPEAAAEAIAAGVPPIVLLGMDQGSFHYVVVTALTPTEAIVHDPNFGPDRMIELDDFLTKWAESDYWMIEVVPGDGYQTDTPDTPDTPHTPDTPAEGASGDVASTAVDPAIDSAMAELRDGRYADAARTALAVTQGPEAFRPVGYRLLATARYLDGDVSGALDAWNAIGEPVVDHVEIDGLAETRYHVAAAQLSVRQGTPLTSRDASLSERRLHALPSVRAARVGYRPNLDGTVQVDGFVLERSRWPGRLSLVRSFVNGVANERSAISTGALMSSGDVWTVAGSWAEAQRGLHGAVSTATTTLPGVLTLSLGVTEERHARPGATAPLDERRLAGSARLSDWVTPNLRIAGSLGIERWTTGSSDAAGTSEEVRAAALGAGVVLASQGDDRWLAVDVDGWAADELFTRTSATAGMYIEPSAWTAVRIRAGAIATSADAPRILWPGAGIGSIRSPLLRAHPLAADGAIAGAAFGPRLAHATAALQIFDRHGPARIGAVLFTDAAAVRTGTDRGTTRFLDYGIGAFADIGGEEVNLSLARGAPGWALSLRVDRWAPSL